MERKKELRRRISELKSHYKTSVILDSQSAKILAALEAHPAFQTAKTVLLYHSLNDEVNTHEFIEKWSGKKRILLPVVIGDVLELRLYTESKNMLTGAYGINEPTGIPFNEYDDIDFIVVPGVAFDNKGNRLGRGKGYYDRLLTQIPNAYKAGICFSFQLVEDVPVDKYDISMDTIITDNEDKLSHAYHTLPSCDRK